MTKKKTDHRRDLKPEEKVLWNLVTRTVVPMHQGSNHIAEEDSSFADHMAALMPTPMKSQPVNEPGLRKAKNAARVAVATERQTAKPKVSMSSPPIAAHIDKPVYRKIAKGRLPIDSQIDLHDMTQDQALYRLQAFLIQARDIGHRHVLVITGKGGSPTSEGVLRRMLPIWLNTPAFSSIVNGYQAASRGHGGDGAFYVRLRRLR